MVDDKVHKTAKHQLSKWNELKNNQIKSQTKPKCLFRGFVQCPIAPHNFVHISVHALTKHRRLVLNKCKQKPKHSQPTRTSRSIFGRQSWRSRTIRRERSERIGQRKKRILTIRRKIPRSEVGQSADNLKNKKKFDAGRQIGGGTLGINYIWIQNHEIGHKCLQLRV